VYRRSIGSRAAKGGESEPQAGRHVARRRGFLVGKAFLGLERTGARWRIHACSLTTAKSSRSRSKFNRQDPAQRRVCVASQRRHGTCGVADSMYCMTITWGVIGSRWPGDAGRLGASDSADMVGWWTAKADSRQAPRRPLAAWHVLNHGVRSFVQKRRRSITRGAENNCFIWACWSRALHGGSRILWRGGCS
jgi:hypothetical protein